MCKLWKRERNTRFGTNGRSSFLEGFAWQDLGALELSPGYSARRFGRIRMPDTTYLILSPIYREQSKFPIPTYISKRCVLQCRYARKAKMYILTLILEYVKERRSKLHFSQSNLTCINSFIILSINFKIVSLAPLIEKRLKSALLLHINKYCAFLVNIFVLF